MWVELCVEALDPLHIDWNISVEKLRLSKSIVSIISFSYQLFNSSQYLDFMVLFILFFSLKISDFFRQYGWIKI